jgi:hypothetical protein
MSKNTERVEVKINTPITYNSMNFSSNDKNNITLQNSLACFYFIH